MDAVSVWLGFVLGLLGAAMIWAGLRRRRRGLQAREKAGRTAEDERAKLNPALAGLRDAMPPLINFFLGLFGLMMVLLWLATDQGRVFSIVDVLGFIVFLTGMCTWFSMRTYYSDLAIAGKGNRG